VLYGMCGKKAMFVREEEFTRCECGEEKGGCECDPL
jgi:hypothetical protein